MTVAEKYRTLRNEHPDAPARSLLAWARTPDAPRREWDERGMGWTASWTEDGFDIVAAIEPDQTDQQGWGFGTFTDTPSATTVRNPRGWTVDGEKLRNEYAYYEPMISYREHRNGLAKLGFSRGESDRLARSYVARELKTATSDDFEFYVISAKASRKGVELGSSSVGGYEFGEKRYSDKLLREFDQALAETGVVAEAISEARRTLDDLLDSELPAPR